MMSAINDLTIAVPRGALFEDTVALLAQLGVDTEELRSNDRKLLFAEIGVITMRPSDVPTYVEAGAADIGITGKDVLAERALGGASATGQSVIGREVYELLDLGYGRCTMVLASIAGEPDPAAEALRRLGVMRVATKYPRDRRPPLRGDRPPGGDRRGEGLGRAGPAHRAGRGDRGPHRDRHHAARERPPGARVDLRVHRPPDRQPGRAQAQGRGDRRPAGAAACAVSGEARVRIERLDAGGRPVALARRLRRLAPLAGDAEDAVAEIVAVVRHEGDEAVLQYTREFDTDGADPPPLLVEPAELDEAIKGLPLERGGGAAGGDRQRRPGRAGERGGGRHRRSCPRASASPCASCRWARRPCTCRGAAPPTRAPP